jgi:2-polyprenyl-6-methoxyphenol hydroxylase-like FAD-dependent oxidoreductase
MSQIAIVGGGIGGLTAGIALQQFGHEVTVYERTPVLSPVGAGITLWSNALKVMEALGIVEELEARGAFPRSGIMGTGRGKLFSNTDNKHLLEMFGGTPVLGIHRADLHEVLCDAMGRERIVLGACCTGLSQDKEGVTLQFEGLEDVRCDVVIGADGIRSAVRRHVFNDGEPRYAGYTCWRGIAPKEAEVDASGELWGRGCRFGIVPIGDGRTYWFATENSAPGLTQTPEEMRASLTRLFGDWSFGIPALIEATPTDAIIRNDLDDKPPRKGWSEGRVVFLGDAIHPTTPNMGQGACMAIESALVLARCLDEFPTYQEAFARYEAVRYPRTSMVTNRSWSFGKIGQWTNPVAVWLRNAMVSMTPPSAVKKQLAPLLGYDARTVSLT